MFDPLDSQSSRESDKYSLSKEVFTKRCGWLVTDYLWFVIRSL